MQSQKRLQWAYSGYDPSRRSFIAAFPSPSFASEIRMADII
jgi:hypothetical protein